MYKPTESASSQHTPLVYQKTSEFPTPAIQQNLALAGLQGLRIASHSYRPQNHVYTRARYPAAQQPRLSDQQHAQIQQFLDLLTNKTGYNDLLFKVTAQISDLTHTTCSTPDLYTIKLLNQIKILLTDYKTQDGLSSTHLTKTQTKSFAIDLLWLKEDDQQQLCILLSRGQNAPTLKLGEGGVHYVSRALRIYTDGTISPCAMRKVNKKRCQSNYRWHATNFKAETQSAQAWARSLSMPQTQLFNHSSFAPPYVHYSTLKSITEVAKYDLMALLEKEEYDDSYKPSIHAKAHIMAALASLLAKAHQNNLVHFDIKPENILFFEKQGWMFTDISPMVSDAQDRYPNKVHGTISYLAPWDILAMSDKSQPFITADRAMSRDCFALGLTFLCILGDGNVFTLYPFGLGDRIHELRAEISTSAHNHNTFRQLQSELRDCLQKCARKPEEIFQDITRTFENIKADNPESKKHHGLYDILLPLFHPQAGSNKALENFETKIQAWLKP